MKTDMRRIVDEMTKAATDSGNLIEAGWLALKIQAIPATASDVQIHEMRKAFFAGAQHLYASIMSILDGGSEPTDKDLKRMELIDTELRQFVKELKEEILT